MARSSLSILVLHEAIEANARPDEVDGLVQVEQVSAALRTGGWRVTALSTGLDLAATLAALRSRRPDCVFNLVESLAGDGRLITLVPALLASAGLVFTGSNADALYLSSHKVLAKQWMDLNGIPTPRTLAPGRRRVGDGCGWIVKSVWEHASLGLDAGCVVTSAHAARTRIDECRRRYGGDWFAEAYVEGREFNISLLEQDGRPVIFPIAEMTFVDFPPGQPRIVGYAAKWDPQAPEYHATQRVFPDLSQNERKILTRVVLDCWRCFGLNGYARVDIRLDAAGRPWVLEVNANPCLSQDAGFAAAAQRGGISFQQLIGTIVYASLPAALRAYRRVG